MLYWFGRRFFNEPAGMVAATTYAVLAASPKMLGLAGHATHFCALFVTAGLCFLWPVGRSLNWKNAARRRFPAWSGGHHEATRSLVLPVGTGSFGS